MKNKSYFYKLYIKRLIIRIFILLTIIIMYIRNPDTFNITIGLNFFKKITLLHIIWLIWIIDMITQLLKVPNYWPLGSQKFMKYRYKKSLDTIDNTIIKKMMNKMNKDSIIIAIIWILLITIIDLIYIIGIIPYQIIIIVSTFFYVCDVICIIIWCPFKSLIMHNKCCTTCRIYNWDHAMMFSPLVVIPGLWTYSLLLMSILVVIIWETSCIKHPERFIEVTNDSLKCINCKDKICGREV